MTLGSVAPDSRTPQDGKHRLDHRPTCRPSEHCSVFLRDQRTLGKRLGKPICDKRLDREIGYRHWRLIFLQQRAGSDLWRMSRARRAPSRTARNATSNSRCQGFAFTALTPCDRPTTTTSLVSTARFPTLNQSRASKGRRHADHRFLDGHRLTREVAEMIRNCGATKDSHRPATPGFPPDHLPENRRSALGNRRKPARECSASSTDGRGTSSRPCLVCTEPSTEGRHQRRRDAHPAQEGDVMPCRTAPIRRGWTGLEPSRRGSIDRWLRAPRRAAWRIVCCCIQVLGSYDALPPRAIPRARPPGRVGRLASKVTHPGRIERKPVV